MRDQLDRAVDLFRSAGFPWWIAGGWGLDLFLGEQRRTHEDVDVLILRRDQDQLQSFLRGWDLHVADPPGTGRLRPWGTGERLELPLHQVWCRREPDAPWEFEVMLGETDGDEWVFRREPSVKLALEVFGGTTSSGIPYVAPEVLLLFKAKDTRPKDQRDFDLVAPRLSPGARTWLRASLFAIDPDHPWLPSL